MVLIDVDFARSLLVSFGNLFGDERGIKLCGSRAVTFGQ